MDKQRQVALVDRISAKGSVSVTEMTDEVFANPVANYLSPERYEQELRLFRQVPLVACLSCDVPNAGDYRVVQILRLSILVVRGSDGRVRAFHNVCSHRGAAVAQGCGNAPHGLRCPFHAWNYALDGSLRSRPLAESFEGMVLARNGALAVIACAETAGIVFVRLDGDDALDAEGWLGGIGEELGEYGLERFTPLETRTSEHSINWKLMQDTFLESYHIPYLHRESFAPYLRPDQVWDAWGPHSRNVGPRWDIAELAGKPRDEWELTSHAVIGYNLFPNINLTHGVDHFVLFRIYPRSIDRCFAEVTWYAPEAPRSDEEWDHWRRTIQFAVTVTENEDFATQERVHANLASGAISSLTYGKNEPALIHFHRSLDRLIEGSSRSCGPAALTSDAVRYTV